jgi:hypothetical protein
MTAGQSHLTGISSRQVVYHSLSQGEGQDHQGRNPAGAVPPDADVPLSGEQNQVANEELVVTNIR